MKVPITCIGGPFDGDAFELEQPYPFIPKSALDEPFWFTADKEPAVSGQGYYQLESPTTMRWMPEPSTP